MKKLRIGQIAPLNIPIPPPKYGGTERIIDAVCNGLTKRGHEVFLFTSKEATTNAHLIPITDKSLWSNEIREVTPYYAYEMSVIVKEAKKLKLDILHDHLGPWSLTLYNSVQVPIVHTLHVPTSTHREWAYSRMNSKLVSISNNQRKAAPKLNYVATVYNGTDTDLYKFNPHPEDYFVFVGELVKRKGVFDAIKIAKKLKIRLLIAGRIPLQTPSQIDDYQFYMKFVKPELNKGLVRYVGEKSGKQLAKLYGNARATLFPLHWEEPFGLIMTESMSCGTPVISFRHGSVPEVIADKKTGFIVDTQAQMEKAIGKINTINRLDCRRRVETKFSLDIMVDNYEKLFYKMLKANKSPKLGFWLTL